jgi:PAS domain S-box-containing protein
VGVLRPYLIAVVSIVSAVLARSLLDPWLGNSMPLVMMFGAVAVAVYFGGYRPGLLATVLGFLACSYLFVEPRGSAWPHDTAQWLGLAAYLLSSGIIVGFGEALHAARRRAVRERGEVAAERERFRLAAEAVNGMIYEINFQTGHVERSRGLYEVLGYHADEVPPPLAWWEEQIHPDDRELARRRFDGAAASNTVVTEYRLRHKDGRWLQVEDRAVILKDGGGKPVRMVGCTVDVTDRKEAEAGRERTLATLNGLVGSAPVGIVMLDSDMRYRHINRPLAEMNGLPADDHIGRTVEQVVPNLYEQVEPLFRRVLGEGITIPDFLLEGETPKAPGVKRVWRESWFPTLGPDGQPCGVGIIVQEITEQQRAETLLKNSEIRYRRLFESAKDGILILDAHTATITEANPFIAETLGYSHDELVGKELWQIGLFKDVEASKAAMRELQEKGYIRYEDLPLETKAGRRINVEFISNVYGEGEGTVIQCNVRDITQRRETEQALAKALIYADDIIATLREPFLVLDADLRVRTANRSFYDSFHVSTGETENQFVYDLGNGQWDIPALRTLLDQVLSRSESVHDYEVEHSFPSLGRKTMLLNARPFPPDSKHPELILLAVEDVSSLRERADELAEAGRRKDEFLATLAHELRNPLAPIRNGLQVMKLAGHDAEAVERSRCMMERQVEQMVRLIDDLMDISRITRGMVELKKQRVPLAAVVSSAVETSGSMIGQMGHELTVMQPEHTVMVDADPTRLAQVFTNLLTNAAKYSERGNHIRLIVERQGSDVVVSVRDTGIGIDADHLPRIFDMFNQVNNSLEKAQGGLGIGLCLVKRLVEMHGGSVEAKSEGRGRGAEFVVRLPIVVEASVPPTAERDAAAAPKSSLRILIVDDNKDGADSLAMMLKIMGNDTRTAYDGQEGVEQAEQYRPDVVLFDIGLPKLNGYEACRRIRGQPWGKSMVLIAGTGWGQDEDRRRSHDAGFDHHLVKPVDPQALMKLLAELNVVKV